MSETKESTEEVPEGFICPISHVIMKDPYIDSDGNSYERQEILDWLRINPVSPITRNPIDASKLVPNRILKSLIEEYSLNHGYGVRPNISPKSNNVTSLLRKSLTLFAVIDNSGSMCESCGANSTGEDDGYSRLDLVKHTLNTIITSLSEHDKICIIKFSTVAEVFSPLTALTDRNKTLLMERLRFLEPENQTNIWDGIRLAVDMIAASQSSDDESNVEIYLLTDGEPNINPPGPIVDTVRNYISRKCGDGAVHALPVIHTFGYGYRLDSSMLYNIARVGRGIFGFIPDSTMVGTVFINALSHSLLRGAADQDSSAIGCSPASARSGGEEKVSDMDNTMSQIASRMCAVLSSLLEGGEAGTAAGASQLEEFVQFATNARGYADSESAKAFIADVIIDCSDNSDPNLGQIFKACKPEFYTKWGKHFLFSVLSAYQRRVCINFKDKGIQHFKSAQFVAEQGRVEDMFVQLPPPKPSRKQNQYNYGYGNNNNNAAYAAAASQPVAMTSYYNVGGGCYSADSFVYGVSSSTGGKVLIKVNALQKGSVVLSNKGETTIECVVKLKYSGKLYSVGSSVQLTPYHPVLIKSVANFPVELENGPKCSGVMPFNGWVYDFVLADRGLLACPFTPSLVLPSHMTALPAGGTWENSLLGSPGNSNMSAPDASRLSLASHSSHISHNSQSSAGGDSHMSYGSGHASSSSSSQFPAQLEPSVMFAATFGHDNTGAKFAHEYFGSEAVVNDLKSQDLDKYLNQGYVEVASYSYARNSKTNLVTHMNVEKVKAK